MPVTCIVTGCGSRADRDKVSFFRLPVVTNFTFKIDLNELSKKRREKWIAAIKRTDLTEAKLKYERVCGRHFLTGKPAAIQDVDHPDWIPSQNMGYVSGKRKRKSDLLRHEHYIARKNLTGDNANCVTQCNLSEMNRKCYVPYCKSGYENCKTKYSVFRVPKDEETRKEWGRAIKRIDKELTDKDCVCEKHFKESDIIRNWQSGGVIVAYRRPRLAPTAVPCIFSYLTEDGKLKRPEEKEIDSSIMKILDNCYGKKDACKKNKDRKVYGMIQHSLFNSIWNDEIKITLPSRSWAMHYLEENTNKYIVLSEMSLQTNNDLNVVRKMTINFDDSIIKTFIKNKEIDILNDRLTSLFPIDDVKVLEIILQSFSEISICTGGPAISLNPDLDFSDEVATIEPTGIWRHVQCVFVKTNEEGYCYKCAELFDAMCWDHLTEVPERVYEKSASKNNVQNV